MKSLRKFEVEYDSSHENAALRARGEFITRFPSTSLAAMALDDYVIGQRQRSFCYLVEAGSKAWANIQGATSFKFGVYFGRTKTDPTRKYRFALKFGANVQDAFETVRAAVLDLVRMGATTEPDFVAIDANPLSQLFKAKILSLYYPQRFLAVCSGEDLATLADVFGFPHGLPFSCYQKLLLEEKRKDATTRNWTPPKFMAFLYDVYVESEPKRSLPIAPPRRKRHRRVDFEQIQKQRAEVGKRAEEYALEWEKARLTGAGLAKLIDRIEDRREYPGYGHDFVSYTGPNEQRFVEVKCVAKVDGGLRFFLSENEHQVSRSVEHRAAYYFYLVLMDGSGAPSDLLALRADQVYQQGQMTPCSYEVRFSRPISRKAKKR